MTTLTGVSEHASWELAEGEEVAPGRTALRAIGGGNRYEVYLVWDATLYSLAVAKLLRPDQVSDDAALRDLRKETEALRALAHPVLIRSFDAVLDGPRPHLLIEHFEGPSLRRLIRRGGPLPLIQLLPVALHVAGALQYMAQAGYVHLDVKPDNLVVTVPPALIDLSIARTIERAGRSDGPLGTDAYMAPEQCGVRGTKPIGPPADVWGLGATLHHAAGGSKPFPRPRDARNSGDAQVRFPQLSADPEPLPSHLPEALRELVASMLAKDPDLRPACDEVVERLEPLVSSMPSKLKLSRGATPLS